MNGDELQAAIEDAEGRRLVAKILERKALADGSVELTLEATPEDAALLRQGMVEGMSIDLDALTAQLPAAIEAMMDRPLFDERLHAETKMLFQLEESPWFRQLEEDPGSLGMHLLSEAARELFEEQGYDGVERVAREALAQRPQLPDLLDAVITQRLSADAARVDAAVRESFAADCGTVVLRDNDGTLLDARPDKLVPRGQLYEFKGTTEETVRQVLEDGIRVE